MMLKIVLVNMVMVDYHMRCKGKSIHLYQGVIEDYYYSLLIPLGDFIGMYRIILYISIQLCSVVLI